MILAQMQQAQLLMLAGFVMLGWVLARRQIALRKRVTQDSRAANRELKAIQKRKDPVAPLSDAPVETQRWQVAMFDLQRELTAELDTRIAVVQTLLRQVDERIETLANVQPDASVANPTAEDEHHTVLQLRISALSHAGLTAQQISEKLQLPIGDVELMLSSSPAAS
ncbi:hypothetical protein [Novipirellula caenicola]|uniref:DUF2802 domain-containing protein n=1 Tax=Novipirellula caenicola TaxID=1536901 RepID=A0ABP9VYK4_9BACT